MNEGTRTIALLAHRCCYVATCGYRRDNGGNSTQALYWDTFIHTPPWSTVYLLLFLWQSANFTQSLLLAAIGELTEGILHTPLLRHAWLQHSSFTQNVHLTQSRCSHCQNLINILPCCTKLAVSLLVSHLIYCMICLRVLCLLSWPFSMAKWFTMNKMISQKFVHYHTSTLTGLINHNQSQGILQPKELVGMDMKTAPCWGCYHLW